MSTCETDTLFSNSTESFEDIYNAMQEDKYWIRFFVRPCCPAPNLEVAIKRLDLLKKEVNKCSDFTAEQKNQIAQIIESRTEWYPSSGLCRIHRSSMAVS